jgi:[histone H3]-lysine36 N-dimethyltransferase SETMAR
MNRQERKPFLHRIITGDEKWILYINTERKNQWLSPGQTPVPVPKTGLHIKKVLLCIWWDCISVIHFELLEPGKTINADLHCKQLERLNRALIEKRPEIVDKEGIILQHDNAMAHSTKKTQQKIKDLGWEVLSHPPYSPDIKPSDYHLFISMQHFLSDKVFRNINDIKISLSKFFASKPTTFYKEGIKNLVRRWAIILDNDGYYITD